MDYPTGTDTSFGYDPVGRWNSMTDATGVSSRVHNLVGQVTSLTTPQGSFTYTYSADLGQPNTMVDSSGTWTALYDQYHRSVGMTNPWGETTTVSFDSAGRVERKNLPNGMYEKYTFDNRSRPTHIRTYNSANSLQDTKSYSWDLASRITDAVEGGVTTSYGYDLIDQLESEIKTSLNYNASYTYDANGNRLTRTVNQSTETYAYDDADKLLSIVGGPNPRTYTYDLAGRTKTIVDTSGTTAFTYDYDGRATSITYPNTTSDSFGYNGLGARMTSSGVNGSKTFRRAGLGVTSSVLSDGTKKYTPGISSRENGVSTFQHSGLKNALDQTDSSQSVTASRHYDAFGNVIKSSGSWQGPFG
ncbi:MAG: RHS repeat protein, partial [Armatimonadetes bacterium]|nr:RHS repeat protein [Armatimonadota bacterium]